MSSIPTAFPASDDSQDLAAVTPVQVHAAIEGIKEARAALRAKEGDALAEASIEGQALAMAQGLLERVLPMLGI